MTRRSTDQRRRRVVMGGARKSSDPSSKSGGASAASTRESPRGRSRGYSQAAMRQCQFRTTDLIPREFLTFGWIALALVGLMACINLLSGFSTYLDLESALPKYDRLSAFSMAGSQGLTAWVSSFLLILSSLASLQVYALRQHRSNDYRGTYRVWIWLAVFLMLASVNCIVDLEAAGRQLARGWNLTSGNGTSTLPIIVKLSCLAILVIRGIIEVRSSPTSIALVVVVWLAYSMAIAVQMPVVNRNIVFEFDPTYGNSLLFGSVVLFLAVLVYARLVLLQSLGLAAINRSAAKSAKNKTNKLKSNRGKTRAKSKSVSEAVEDEEVAAEADETVEEDDESEAEESSSKVESKNTVGQKANSANTAPVAKPVTPAPTSQLPSNRSASVSSAGQGPLQSKMAVTSSVNNVDDDDDEDESQQDGQRNLSKAERRKLRKAQSQQQQQQRRAA